MISVCIPTYNGEKFIKEQLDSILIQLGNSDEIIISDDSSTDRTIEIIESYSDTRIKLLPKNNFKSPIFNLENALKEAKGDYIFLSDQDDVWLENKIEVCLEYLKNYNLVVSNAFIVDKNKFIIEDSYFNWKNSGPGFLKNFHKNSFLGCSMAFDKKVLNWTLPFPKKIAMHDIWIGLLTQIKGKVYFIEQPLFYYRRHDLNYTAAITKDKDNLSEFSFFKKVSYRLAFLKFLFLRIVLNR